MIFEGAWDGTGWLAWDWLGWGCMSIGNEGWEWGKIDLWAGGDE